MPRQPRIDGPGLLQHVMARGIETGEIFKDDKDRKSFLDRLAIILEETKTQCYAWSLLPNHFHLLLRTGHTPLSKVMRRLMTGYAVTFNKMHKRSGYLFQNRYKSVVCEEDPYLLELIRYIHLNPLRGKLVKNLKELDKHPWTGHSAILGYRNNPLVPKKLDKPHKPDEQVNLRKPLAENTIEDVLLHFGETKEVARGRYREFVKNGIDQGTRPEFQGGGLVRSTGGNKGGLLGRKKEEREKGDARILGSGGFVNETLMKAGEDWEKGKRKKMPIEQLIRTVASHFDLKGASIISASRKREVSEARGIICYLAVNDLGYNTSEVGRALSINRENAARCSVRGKKAIGKYADLRDIAN